jgi:predicted ArsR family transcriptional regulator
VSDPGVESRIGAVAALADPVRRALYVHVAGAGGEVSRADAAAAVGVARSVAAFHLDRLAAEGLLDVATRRTTGRSGPGAGRPARLYRRAARDVAVSLPPRDYELAAHLLAGAVEQAGAEEGLEAGARALGERLGAERAATAGEGLPAAAAVLRARGFEPYEDAGELRLRNCPFHSLATSFPVLVCAMNRAFVEGMAHGAGVAGAHARLDPRPGDCCVVLSMSNNS